MRKNMNWRLATSVCVAACLAVTQLQLSAFAEEALKIAVVEHYQDEIIVEVSSGNIPATGADVVFSLPDSAQAGHFSNGARRLTVRADAQGRAKSGSIQMNKDGGADSITVMASLRGMTGTAVVQQSTTEAAKAKPRKRRLKWILIGAGAVGAAAAVILLKGGSKEPVVTIGAPTVGSPQ